VSALGSLSFDARTIATAESYDGKPSEVYGGMFVDGYGGGEVTSGTGCGGKVTSGTGCGGEVTSGTGCGGEVTLGTGCGGEVTLGTGRGKE